jgi:membrane associated rhomboid family serine protease
MLPLRDHLPVRRTPVVNYLLLATNIAVFFGERALIGLGYPPQQLVADWGLVPARFGHAPLEEAVTVFTSMFLHDPAGWLHLGGNMLFLYIFGDNVEDAIGSLRYLVFYVLSGTGAAAAQILIDPTSTTPMIGASGAIAGVLAAYASLYPMSRITVLNPFLPLWLLFGPFLDLPAFVVVLIFFAMNLVNGLFALQQVGGVAFFAHLGGFITGLLLIRVFMGDRARQEHERWKTWRRAARPGAPGGPRRSRPPGPWEW